MGKKTKEGGSDGLAWDSALDIVVEPPAFREAKSERQELSLGRQLVGYEQAALAQQRLAVLNGDLHVARRMQHVGGKEDVITPDAIPLRAKGA